ncbi:hypothetical protein D3C71_1950550 [compost metagenome]
MVELAEGALVLEALAVAVTAAAHLHLHQVARVSEDDVPRLEHHTVGLDVRALLLTLASVRNGNLDVRF